MGNQTDPGLLTICGGIDTSSRRQRPRPSHHTMKAGSSGAGGSDTVQKLRLYRWWHKRARVLLDRIPSVLDEERKMSGTVREFERLLGNAALRLWPDLPRDVQEKLFETAVPLDPAIRNRLAIFLHERWPIHLSQRHWPKTKRAVTVRLG